MKTPFKTRGARAITVLLAAVLLCPLAPASGVTRLVEDYQVIQRDQNDLASFVIQLPAAAREGSYDLLIVDDGGTIKKRESVRVGASGGERTIEVESVPVGGPYTISLSAPGSDLAAKPVVAFRNILIGDIWILGGQSNMFGFNVPPDGLPALPYLNIFDMQQFDEQGHWIAGVPPLHRMSAQFSGNFIRLRPGLSENEVQEWISKKRPAGGMGPGYFFAQKLCAESHVPIGVIPVATGAALAIWDPDKRDQNRYGFTARHVLSTGRRVKGMLWFQGEQDAIYGDEHQTVTKPSLIYPIATYSQEFRKFVGALRTDFSTPDMPVIVVQIGRFHQGSRTRDRYWEMMRDIQRRIPEEIGNVHTVPSVDLDSFDGIHLAYDSYKRLDARMAYLALPHVKKGVPPRSEIKLESAKYSATPIAAPRGGGFPIIVTFSGVSGKLRSPGKPTGFRLRKRGSTEDEAWIYDVQFEPARPNQVVLYWRSGPKDTLDTVKSRNVVLYYGTGSAPYVNIVDQNDMAVPAFGPVEIE